MASYLDIKELILKRILNSSDKNEKIQLYKKLYRLNEAYGMFNDALEHFEQEINPNDKKINSSKPGTDMNDGSGNEGNGVDQSYSSDSANIQSTQGSFDEKEADITISMNGKKKKKKLKSTSFSLSIEPEQPSPDGQLAYSSIEHEDDIESYSCHIPEDIGDKDYYTDPLSRISYEKSPNGTWKRVLRDPVGGNAVFSDKNKKPYSPPKIHQIGIHDFSVVSGSKIKENLKMKAGEGRDFYSWNAQTGRIWFKNGHDGKWYRSNSRYHTKETAKPVFSEIKSHIASLVKETDDFAEGKVYIYNGKTYRRCPRGTTGVGKTCVPRKSNKSKKLNKKRSKSEEGSDKQIELLSKAKSHKDIVKARKQSGKRRRKKISNDN